MLKDDKVSSLGFMIRNISRTIFHQKMLVIPYFQVQPNIPHIHINVGNSTFFCDFFSSGMPEKVFFLLHYHSYNKNNGFIATQSPPPDTIPDLWRIFVVCDCSTIAALNWFIIIVYFTVRNNAFTYICKGA